MKKRKVHRIRKIWLINPRTRIEKSKKIYQRQRTKQEFKNRLREELKNEDT